MTPATRQVLEALRRAIEDDPELAEQVEEVAERVRERVEESK